MKMAAFRVLCSLTILVGLLTATTRAHDADANESRCTEEIEDELREYVKSEVWQRLFARHYKFVVNENGDVTSGRMRLKFNTIMHNALYGCNHDRDDEVDDCPNICRGCIKSCRRGKNLRAAMFRTARCAFVESTVKHVVLSDILLDTIPSDELVGAAELVDRPIREFGETVVDMLSVLAHGETGGLAELMSVNLYLNNKYGTVLMAAVPPTRLTGAADAAAAVARARAVHASLLDRLRAFWTTWCSDRDLVHQYRAKYGRGGGEGGGEGGGGPAGPGDVTRDMRANVDDAGDLLRGLNVADRAVVDWDFDPERAALARFADRLVAGRSMAAELLADVRLAAFECSYEFDPRALYARLRRSVFRPVLVCFYWTAIAHLRLAVRYADDTETWAATGRHAAFARRFVGFARPLAVFRDNDRRRSGLLSSARASRTVSRLLSFFARFDRGTTGRPAPDADRLLSYRPEMRKFVGLLTADMERVTGLPPPPDYFGRLSYVTALEFMRSNYRAFARLVSATSSCREDIENFMKLKKFFFYISEFVGFDGLY